MNDSNTLANIGVREMGLNWSKEVMFFYFGTGVIAAVFQISGKIPSYMHLFKMQVNGSAKLNANSFINVTDKSIEWPDLHVVAFKCRGTAFLGPHEIFLLIK